MKFHNYPFKSNFLDLNGLRLHYVDEGPRDAEPIVMVHGNPTWSYYYRNLINGLKDAHRCIALDHMGMGLSDRPSDSCYEHTLSQRASDLEALLEELKINRNITMIVHDWGGMIGMTYATKYADRIKKLVILNTAAFRLPEGKPLPWQLKLCRTPLLGALLVRGFNAFSRGAVRDCVAKQPLPEAVCRAYLDPYDSWKNRLAVLRFVEDIPLKPTDKAYGTMETVEKNLSKLSQTPMLICWGMKDFVFDEHFLTEWEKHFPDAEVHRFEDAGHYVLEDEGEAILGLIRKFLS